MSLLSYNFMRFSENLKDLSFECKDDDLNNFLHDDALLYQQELMAVTYVFVDPLNNTIVGYFSLLNDKVSYDPEKQSFWSRLSRKISNRKRRRSYPSVKIGRLAVSKKYERQNIGREIIEFVKHAFTQGNRTGCRFLTVDAYSEATGFYEKCGFKFFTDNDKEEKTRLMYFDLKPFKDAQDSAL